MSVSIFVFLSYFLKPNLFVELLFLIGRIKHVFAIMYICKPFRTLRYSERLQLHTYSVPNVEKYRYNQWYNQHN
jgi:hypothetical protein